jgi:hypothetical protein
MNKSKGGDNNEVEELDMEEEPRHEAVNQYYNLSISNDNGGQLD